MTFIHADDVLVVVALDMLKMPNAGNPTEYGVLHSHCPAMILESISSKLLVRGVIGRDLSDDFNDLQD